MNKEETKIGFIGTGVMGKSMALHLIKAGYTVLVYSRTKEKAAQLISQGASWIHSPKELAKQANIVITMVGYPDDVKSIYLGEEGLIENANPHTYLIDMTTSTPTLAKEIAERAKQKEIYAIDAPVSGGDIGAKSGKLSIMVGGEDTAYQAILPILQYMGENIVYQGVAGAGQHTKMANQIAIASNMIGVCEAIIYAEKAGLNSENVLKSITSGAAGSWSLSNLVPRMISGDFSPGFYIKHFIKDMTIALDEAEKMGMETPGLRLAREMYEKLAAEGEGESGTQALYKYWER
ncbi:NAD(P)-dependent oxidoreductase [Cytobacillus kochii]|uniref:NAD(P)-dependent oxidoreductase n=1 Tax=Cytobacillus kochii TaxID=859143 RepID=UPI001CD38516|nr:NAD(P)-dependent oxidoreductase [Cytobacillus kochii]MCA1027591.1 NAD(P)-dependent oxidoreductase [Cytobacillus kochii]MCM3321900.1 NAD(P)-dependent oxidoreductase [Cytobacillus kochii]MCM3343266.1 NAD(P)-dependent oxidoreductase [Cytobacillus kochii]MDM5207096.1 NAD(P)-dependent oxidoreductase [Cytobacillus kochii]